jgi:hypothetical protein
MAQVDGKRRIMNKLAANPGASRRQFLRDGIRLAVLGGLSAVGGKLAGRAAALPARQVCISAGLCRSCAVFEDCGLPGALSAKQALGRTPTRQI